MPGGWPRYALSSIRSGRENSISLFATRSAYQSPRQDHDRREVLMAFEKSVLVPLNADDTFALITDPDRLRRWQGIPARVDLRAGGDYRWTIIPGHSVAGTITEVEPGRHVVFTWGWEGSADLPP